MKLYVFEPYGVKSGKGENTSERFDEIMNKLKLYSPKELRLNDISSTELKRSWSEENDNDETIIIAHYSDVEDHFDELESFSRALCVFHTYKTTWYKGKANHDTDVLRISNHKNRFCCDSERIKAKIDVFVSEFLNKKDANSAFDVITGFDPKYERYLLPFETVSPLDSSQWRSKLIQAKGKLNDYLKND